MFRSGSPSSRFLTQQAGLDRAMVNQYKSYHKIIDPLIKIAATTILSEFDKLKNTLEIAVTAYLKEIEYKFFRNDGQERAQALNKKITESNNISELIPALEEVIKKGNEDDDSLKTFLFKSINLNFCDNKIYPFYAVRYTDLLKMIIKEIKKQFEPIRLENTSGLSEVDNDAERKSSSVSSYGTVETSVSGIEFFKPDNKTVKKTNTQTIIEDFDPSDREYQTLKPKGSGSSCNIL